MPEDLMVVEIDNDHMLRSALGARASGSWRALGRVLGRQPRRRVIFSFLRITLRHGLACRHQVPRRPWPVA